MRRILLLIVFFQLSFHSAKSGCTTYPVSLSNRTQQSFDIVEAKVTAKQSFWNAQHDFIYTDYTLQVFKNFKGKISSYYIHLIAEGGIVDDSMIKSEPSLEPELNASGIFFLEEINDSETSLNRFVAYSFNQGFIEYDLKSLTASDPYNSYSSIQNDVVDVIQNLSGNSYNSIQTFNYSTNSGHGNSILVPPVITTITLIAGTNSAGTFSTVRITGNNFGVGPFSGSRNLEFRDANNGGAGFISTPANHILSWANTQIDAYIPTGAGTGTIRVTNDLSESTISAGSVTINYNESNVNSSGIYYQPDLIDQNLTGGYTFRYNTTFNGNAPAVTAFETALQTWRCNTYVNFSKSGTTALSCQALDGTNLVTFDGACALPAGVLGISYSYYARCGTSSWYLNENDLKFRTNGTGGINWNYGPAATAGGLYDFESVCLHELGHSHQLGHTILPVTVMNYAVGPNTDRRTLTPISETTGGLDIMSRSVVANPCLPGPMIALDNSNCQINSPTANFSGTPLSGCNNINVTFTDLSSNTPTSWAWTFTGPFAPIPATSALQNPVVNFPGPGTYTVRLIVYNALGNDTITKVNYITVNNCPPPVADFTGTPTTICAGQQVNFVDNSTNTPTSWNWTFPGGTPGTSTAQNPSVVYAAPGVYNVTLTATNAYGNNTITKSNYITVNNCPPPPVANFTASPLVACAGDSIQFTDASTNFPNYWQWTFPGGSPATSLAQNPKIKYNSPGTYSITLTVSNSQGTSTFTRNNYITINTCSAPVANFGATPTSICTGQNVAFTDLSSNAPTSWSWSFPGGTPATSAVQNPTINYAAAGTYNVTLTATNGFGGNSITQNNIITVSNCPAAGTGLIVNDGSLIHVQVGAIVRVEGGFINQDNSVNIGTIEDFGQISLTGDWTNHSNSNAFSSSSTGELLMNGAAQNITGTVSTYFPNLTLAGTGIKTMTLNARTTGTLALTDRELATGTNTMVVTNPATTAVTRTGGFNSTPVQGFVSSTGAGRLQRYTNTTQAYLFPVGSSIPPARYRPVEITPTLTPTNIWAVRFVNNDPTLNGYDVTLKDPSLGNINNLWYQKINHAGGSSPCAIKIYVDVTADAIFTMSNLLMCEWGWITPPPQWNDMGLTSTTQVASPALSSISKAGWNNYNTENFNVAPLSVPLPVELLTFKGDCDVKGISLKWITASESNNDFFTLEKSLDGNEFFSIANIPGAGNSGSELNYYFNDLFDVNADIVYYRLRQTDFDGKTTITVPIAVSCKYKNSKGDVAGVYPNPATNTLNIILNSSIDGNVSVMITDPLGQVILKENYLVNKGFQKLVLNLSALRPQIYNLNIATSNSNYSEKLLKLE